LNKRIEKSFGAETAKRKNVAGRRKNNIFIVVLGQTLKKLGILAEFGGFIVAADVVESSSFNSLHGAKGEGNLEDFAGFNAKITEGGKNFFGGFAGINFDVSGQKMGTVFFKSVVDFFKKIFGNLSVGVKKDKNFSQSHFGTKISLKGDTSGYSGFETKGILGRKRRNDFGSRIFGITVDNNNFKIGKSLGIEIFQKLRKIFLFIEAGDDDGKIWCHKISR
jgi:hypothetical protein